jgi:hypothetical protein
VDHPLAAVHAPQRVDELLDRGVLEHVAGHAGVECAAQVAAAREGRDDDDAGRRAAPCQLGGHVEPAAARHLDVGQQHVRLRVHHGRERLVTIGRGRHDLDVRFEGEQGRERPEHHPLILRQHRANRHVT